MNRYVLLRNNKQEGPFSFEELVGKQLKSFDLIWKEEQSSYWLYPFEVEELKPFVNHNHFSQKESLINDLKSHYIPDLKTRFQQPVDVLKQNYINHYQQTKFSYHKTAINIIGLMTAVLCGLLIIGALSVKNVFHAGNIKDGEPIVLSTGKIHSPALPEGSVPDKPVNKHIQNALVTELVAVERKDELQKKQLFHNLKKKITITSNQNSTVNKNEIKNLYLTIENKLPILLRNVKVQVNYLNSFGQLIYSQVITIKNVPAMGEKSWKMVDAKQAVKVEYKILDFFSKPQSTIYLET